MRTSCPKAIYLSRAEAVVTVKRAARGRPYRCGRCGYWHITSKPRIPASRRRPKKPKPKP